MVTPRCTCHASNDLCWLHAVQVLHLCSVVCPNYDATYATSVVWTSVQLIYSGFLVNFSLVGGLGWR